MVFFLTYFFKGRIEEAEAIYLQGAKKADATVKYAQLLERLGLFYDSQNRVDEAKKWLFLAWEVEQIL